MKYRIIGAGYTSVTFARMLKGTGFSVGVFDKGLTYLCL